MASNRRENSPKLLVLHYRGVRQRVKFFSGISRNDFMISLREVLGLKPLSPLRFRDAEGDVTLVSPTGVPDVCELHVEVASGAPLQESPPMRVKKVEREEEEQDDDEREDEEVEKETDKTRSNAFRPALCSRCQPVARDHGVRFPFSGPPDNYRQVTNPLIHEDNDRTPTFPVYPPPPLDAEGKNIIYIKSPTVKRAAISWQKCAGGEISIDGTKFNTPDDGNGNWADRWSVLSSPLPHRSCYFTVQFDCTTCCLGFGLVPAHAESVPCMREVIGDGHWPFVLPLQGYGKRRSKMFRCNGPRFQGAITLGAYQDIVVVDNVVDVDVAVVVSVVVDRINVMGLL